MTADRQLYTWGKGYGGCLGQGHDEDVPVPAVVNALVGRKVTQVSPRLKS